MLAALLVLSVCQPVAHAQCGAKTSTCRVCHEVRREGPAFDATTPWHHDHAFADLCPSCHGGDGQAKDAARAHAGRMHPLADPTVTCATCHGDGAARSTAYARALPAPSSADAGAPPAGVSPSSGGGPANAPRAPLTTTGNRSLALASLAVAAAGAWLVAWNERRHRAARAPSRGEPS
jgi:hypothetical protein